MATIWKVLYVPEVDAEEFRAEIAARQLVRMEPPAPDIEEVDARHAHAEAVLRGALDRQPSWSSTALARLAEDNTKTGKRWVVVMDHCAENPGSWYSTEAIARETDLSVQDWRSACRTIKRIFHHFDDIPVWPTGPYKGEMAWPLAAASGRSIGVKDQLYVAMNDKQAELWLEVRGASSSS